MRLRVTDDYLLDQIAELKISAAKHREEMRPGRRRFKNYRYLRDVYKVYLNLHSRRRFKKAVRRIAKELQLSCNKKAHPIRILIEASCGPEDARQKSRMTKSLIFALGWLTKPTRLIWLFEHSGGISGAASKLAVNNGTTRRKKNATITDQPISAPQLNDSAV